MKNNKKTKLGADELVKQRDQLLDEHPELKPVQKQIDGKLKGAGLDPNERARIMFEEMMEQYGREMSPALDEMESIKSVMSEIKSKKKKSKL